MKLRLRLVLFLFPIFFHAAAQKAFNGDSLLVVARYNAISNNYPLALEQCDTILNHYPDYTDVKILKARINSWNKNYPVAKAILEKVIAEKADNMEAHQAITDNALWSGQPEEAIINADKGLLVDAKNLDLLLKKVKAQIQLKKYKDAEKTLAIIKQISPDNEDAAELAKEITILKRTNTVALYNLHDWFSSVFGQRNLLSLEYKRATSIGPVSGRVNYANRFGFNELQYEADFYPRLTNRLSGYLNYGYSPANNIFPQHKVGAELYYSFSKKITASAGIRYMVFTGNNLLSYTGAVGIYSGKYWFGARVFVTPTPERVAESVYVLIRRFFKNDLNYITLTMGQGVSPENSSNSINFNTFYYLNSQNAKLQWVKTIGERYSFQLGGDFIRLQTAFDSSKYIFQFTLDTGIKYQF